MVGQARAGGDAEPLVTVVAPSRDPHPFEMWISHTLRVGVFISGTILATGLMLFFARGTASGHPSSLHELIHTPSSTVSLPAVLRDAMHARTSAIIRLGVLALILTPVVRVAMTAALFVAVRDWVFLAIVVTVLGILLVGLTGIVG
jgi:uncharacterized membrane protein